MPDQTLEFLIKTKAELSGAQAAAKAMEQDIVAAKASGKEYQQLETQLKSTTDAIKQFKGAKDQLKSAEKNRSPSKPNSAKQRG